MYIKRNPDARWPRRAVVPEELKPFWDNLRDGVQMECDPEDDEYKYFVDLSGCCVVVGQWPEEGVTDDDS